MLFSSLVSGLFETYSTNNVANSTMRCCTPAPSFSMSMIGNLHWWRTRFYYALDQQRNRFMPSTSLLRQTGAVILARPLLTEARQEKRPTRKLCRRRLKRPPDALTDNEHC